MKKSVRGKIFLKKNKSVTLVFGTLEKGGLDGPHGIHVLRFEFAIILSKQLPIGLSKLSLFKILAILARSRLGLLEKQH